MNQTANTMNQRAEKFAPDPATKAARAFLREILKSGTVADYTDALKWLTDTARAAIQADSIAPAREIFEQTNPHRYRRKTSDDFKILRFDAGQWREVESAEGQTQARQKLKEYQQNEPGTAFKLSASRVKPTTPEQDAAARLLIGTS